MATDDGNGGDDDDGDDDGDEDGGDECVMQMVSGDIAKTTV